MIAVHTYLVLVQMDFIYDKLTGLIKKMKNHS
jgi:hypothetical protein